MSARLDGNPEWRELEQAVRRTASAIWNTPAAAEHINGVDVDCVLRPRHDHHVLIEASVESTLAKLRTDLAKFASVRPLLFSQGIYVECFFVCSTEPPPSLVETGIGHNVTVQSLERFKKTLFDYPRYRHVRSSRQFGSAVDPVSGRKDTIPYIPVIYRGVSSKQQYSLDDIFRLLVRQHHKIILLGNYGTGKSRCIQEIFSRLDPAAAKATYALSIDLRDHWGVRRGHEIVRRHFDDLGLSPLADGVLRIAQEDSLCLLLDGFDEIGSQAWSDNPGRLRDIRLRSLLGVKDLIAKSRGGLLITGREHYFNGNQEMFEALGLDPLHTTVIASPDEFSTLEVERYLSSIGTDVSIPQWLPKRPLTCQILAALDSDARRSVLEGDQGEVEFWHTLIEAVCKRESTINVALEPDTIRQVLVRVARATRTKPADVGPITTGEINAAFEAVVGIPAVDESAVMLQRLPTLGRVAAETTDRQFVDFYFLDGLRADDVIAAVASHDHSVGKEVWSSPLRPFGLALVAYDIEARKAYDEYLRFVHNIKTSANKVLLSDVVAALMLAGDCRDYDFRDLLVEHGHFVTLNLAESKISNLTIRESIIETLDIVDAAPTNVHITSSLISRLYGVSSEQGVPEWISMCTIEVYESLSNVARIRGADLTDQQRVFVTMVKKLFLQPGAGREEVALLRGLGAMADRRITNRILNMLLTEGVINSFKGAEGKVYTPNREYTHRIKRILSQLTLSEDPLWLRLT